MRTPNSPQAIPGSANFSLALFCQGCLFLLLGMGGAGAEKGTRSTSQNVAGAQERSEWMDELSNALINGEQGFFSLQPRDLHWFCPCIWRCPGSLPAEHCRHNTLPIKEVQRGCLSLPQTQTPLAGTSVTGGRWLCPVVRHLFGASGGFSCSVFWNPQLPAEPPVQRSALASGLGLARDTPEWVGSAARSSP